MDASRLSNDLAIEPAWLDRRRASSLPPMILDVRRQPAFDADSRLLPGAIRRDPARLPDWSAAITADRPVVACCVHGHEVSQGVARTLRAQGIDAYYLSGGIEGWKASGLPTRSRPPGVPLSGSRWITRERPKIDRVACPWFVLRFVDPLAAFDFVPVGDVFSVARDRRAIPFDIPGAEPFTHAGENCSFDAFVREFDIDEPALSRIAAVVRGADTDRLALAPQAAGLLAVSLGLSRLFADDDAAMLTHGLMVYDALYAWARDAGNEAHDWPPAVPAGASR